MIVALFFQCMAALLNSDHRRGKPIKWGLVTYTVVMLSVATVQTAMNLNILSISYIDNRAFPGIEGVLSPGPWGYQLFISPEVLSIIPNVMFTLSNWLADGLLVRSSFCTVSVQISNSAPPALSLLHNLLQEHLGRRLPLSHVPRFRGCVFGFSTGLWRYLGLMPLYSDGYRARLPERGSRWQHLVRPSILFDFDFT